MMLDEILEQIDSLRQRFDAESRQLLRQLIDPTHQPPSQWRGRTPPSYLFEIVANAKTSLDVDKLDYLARDSYYVGIQTLPASFSHRLIAEARVVNDRIAWPIKAAYDVFQLFQLRFSMFKRVYSHRTAKAIEYMLTDAMLLADETLRISAAAHDPKRFVHLNDSVLDAIRTYDVDDQLQRRRGLQSLLDKRDLPLAAQAELQRLIDELPSESALIKMQQAQQLLDRVSRRRLYRLCFEIPLPPVMMRLEEITADHICACQPLSSERIESSEASLWEWGSSSAGEDTEEDEEQPLDDDDDVCESLSQPSSYPQALTARQILLPSDLGVQNLKLNFSMKDKNPLEQIPFFSKIDRDSSVFQSADAISATLPSAFQERTLRIFLKRPTSWRKHLVRIAVQELCARLGIRQFRDQLQQVRDEAKVSTQRLEMLLPKIDQMLPASSADTAAHLARIEKVRDSLEFDRRQRTRGSTSPPASATRAAPSASPLARPSVATSSVDKTSTTERTPHKSPRASDALMRTQSAPSVASAVRLGYDHSKRSADAEAVGADANIKRRRL